AHRDRHGPAGRAAGRGGPQGHRDRRARRRQAPPVGAMMEAAREAARVRVAVEAAACAEPELAALELARSGGTAGAGRVVPGGAALRGARLVDEDAGGARADRLVVAGDAADLARALAAAGPGAVVAVLSRDAAALAAPAASMSAFLARGGTLLGVVAAHPDLLP